MIKINKSERVPPFLLQQQIPNTPAEIDRCEYNAPSVKRQLMCDQHHKCCYCETYLDQYADIEHYRPLKGYIDRRGVFCKPGYYWLKTVWSNLLLSCKCCNTSHKRNHFALVDERARNIPGKDISNEQPLLINPLIDDPALYIKFRQHCAVEIACNGTAERGRYTIETLQLNRSWLRWRRRKRWVEYTEAINELKIVENILAINPMDTDILRLKQLISHRIAGMRSVNSEYSGMINHQLH